MSSQASLLDSSSLPPPAPSAEFSYRYVATPPSCREQRHIFVITVGCFDVFHHGHAALLQHMIDYGGTRLLVGIHDDASILFNKKLRVAQPLAQRISAVKAYAPSLIDMFVVTDPDPTKALIDAYNQHMQLAKENSYSIEWFYMRGKDMPNFPGRTFIESVGIPIVWHDYTKDVSSTMIRNEILPLARSIVNFAEEGCLNENFLQMLEKAALIDHRLVMKCVVQALDHESANESPRHQIENLHISSPAIPSSVTSQVSRSISTDLTPTSHCQSRDSSPLLESSSSSPRSDSQSDSSKPVLLELPRPRVHSAKRFAYPLNTSSDADDITDNGHRLAALPKIDPKADPTIRGSPHVATEPSLAAGKQEVLLEIIAGLFGLYRERTKELMAARMQNNNALSPISSRVSPVHALQSTIPS